MALAAVPVFAWIAADRTSGALLAGVAILSILQQIGTGTAWVWFAEMLPMQVRGRGFGTVFGLSLALFGGTAQMVVTWLIHVTGSELAPGWYMAVMCALGAAGALFMPETAPAQVARRGLARAAA